MNGGLTCFIHIDELNGWNEYRLQIEKLKKLTR